MKTVRRQTSARRNPRLSSPPKPTELDTDRRLTRCSLIVYRYIYGMIVTNKDKLGYCWASNAHLARAMGYCENSISNSIGKLVKCGYLHRHFYVHRRATDRKLFLGAGKELAIHGASEVELKTAASDPAWAQRAVSMVMGVRVAPNSLNSPGWVECMKEVFFRKPEAEQETILWNLENALGFIFSTKGQRVICVDAGGETKLCRKWGQIPSQVNALLSELLPNPQPLSEERGEGIFSTPGMGCDRPEAKGSPDRASMDGLHKDRPDTTGIPGTAGESSQKASLAASPALAAEEPRQIRLVESGVRKPRLVAMTDGKGKVVMERKKLNFRPVTVRMQRVEEDPCYPAVCQVWPDFKLNPYTARQYFKMKEALILTPQRASMLVSRRGELRRRVLEGGFGAAIADKEEVLHQIEMEGYSRYADECELRLDADLEAKRLMEMEAGVPF